jgi:rhodanese-related sulfurtransferase
MVIDSIESYLIEIMESAAKRESVQEDIPEISREELKLHLHDGSLTIVDVLPAESYATAHIPGALSIPLEVVATRAPELLRDHAAEIVVYCGKLTCDRSEQALEQLQKLGYSNVRDYRAGIADWVESGEATESAASDPKTAAETLDAAATVDGPSLTVSSTGEAGRVPARVSQMRRLDNSVLGFVQQQSTLQLFLTWIVMILLCGAGYWLIGVAGDRSLVEAGAPIGTYLKGLVSAIYFSFVTATSVGYGDVLPIGFARAIAVAEAVSALLIFGAVVAKFVSHRQEQLVLEIHRVTFEERLDRVQTNLHTVISDLLSIADIFQAGASLNGISARLDSSVIMFLGEMRTTHDLLYQPRLTVEERALSPILANTSSALTILSELLAHLPPGFVRSEPLRVSLENLERLAEEICADCLPYDYTPRLVFWMERIQATAQKIK